MRQFLLGLVLALSAVSARAETTALEHLELLPGWRMENGHHMAGVEIRLAPGWKTYWRRPGEAGIPPSFNWSGSDNVADVRIHWPAPQVTRSSGMRSVVYKEHVVLPVEITPRDPARPIRLRLEADMGVCDDICMPVQAEAQADLSPARGTRPDARIRGALAMRPFNPSEAGVSGARCEVRLVPGGAQLTATLTMPPLGRAEEIVFEPSDPRLWVSEPRARRSGSVLVAEAEIAAPRGEPLMLDRRGLKITVIGDVGTAEIEGCS